MMLTSVLGGASLAKKALGALSSNDKDAERVEKVRAALTRALNGDTASLQWLQAAAGPGSAHPKATRDAAKLALDSYANQRATFQTTIGQPTPLQQQVAATVSNIRDEVAGFVQNVGAGATTAAANRIAPTSGAFTVPLNTNQLVLFAALAVAIIMLRR